MRRSTGLPRDSFLSDTDIVAAVAPADIVRSADFVHTERRTALRMDAEPAYVSCRLACEEVRRQSSPSSTASLPASGGELTPSLVKMFGTWVWAVRGLM